MQVGAYKKSLFSSCSCLIQPGEHRPFIFLLGGWWDGSCSGLQDHQHRQPICQTPSAVGPKWGGNSGKPRARAALQVAAWPDSACLHHIQASTRTGLLSLAITFLLEGSHCSKGVHKPWADNAKLKTSPWTVPASS